MEVEMARNDVRHEQDHDKGNGTGWTPDDLVSFGLACRNAPEAWARFCELCPIPADAWERLAKDAEAAQQEKVRANSSADKSARDADKGAREAMAQGLNDFVLDPLALLAGLIDGAGEELDAGDTGKLLGLLVRGARAEIEIHRGGGYGARELRRLLGALEQQVSGSTP
jgi:hypothetical protein